MRIDWAILEWIEDTFVCAFLDKVMPAITHLGDHGMIWIAIALILLCHDRTRETGKRMLLGMLCGFLIGNVVLKNLIRRARPCWFYPERELLIPSPKDFSFPSGHTLSSFIAAFTLFRRDRKAGTAALILASCIAFSRLYLYVHFPSDIIGGVLLGYAVAGLTGRIFEMLSAKGGTKENTRT